MSKKTSVTEKTFDIVNCKSYLVGDLRKLYAQLYDVSISKAQKVPKDDLCPEIEKMIRKKENYVVKKKSPKKKSSEKKKLLSPIPKKSSKDLLENFTVSEIVMVINHSSSFQQMNEFFE